MEIMDIKESNESIISDEELMQLYQLKDVIRYNCRKHLKDESVAEHSYYVALFAMMICNKHHVSDKTKIDAISKALLHDLPEIETNDITHDVKEKLHLRPLLKKYEDEYYEKNFKQNAALMKDDSDNLVNAIVLYADILSVRQFCMNEVIMGNKDKDIMHILEDTNKRIEYASKNFKKVMKNA